MQLVERTIRGCRFLGVDSWWDAGVVHGFGCADLNAAEAVAWFEAGGSPLALLKQEHGDTVIEWNGTTGCRGDGWLVTPGSLPRHAVGILTADCLPVLLRDRHGRAAAALHCGWRGVAKGLLPKTIGLLVERGMSPIDVEVAIGPGAQVCCYEVKEDVAAMFGRNVSERAERLFADLGAELAIQAEQAGVRRIIRTWRCTICSAHYFSFRRQGEGAGRQISFLGR